VVTAVVGLYAERAEDGIRALGSQTDWRQLLPDEPENLRFAAPPLD
jgi:hypothetical protein